jgi:hypothetical protein
MISLVIIIWYDLHRPIILPAGVRFPPAGHMLFSLAFCTGMVQ